MKKEGSAFDLRMAVGILGASGCVREQNLSEYLFLGELSLPIRLSLNASFSSTFRSARTVNLLVS